jgi:uncharacterized membrane protein YbhN (UPF0104 family)
VSSRPGGRRVALALLLAAALALAVGSLAAQWPDVRAGAAELSVGPTAGAVAAVLLSLGANLLAWQAMLAGLGVEVPLRRAARIFFVGQLGKYVPGSIWPVVAQMELGAGYGLSRSVIGAAGLLTLGVAVPVGLLLGLLAVPALLSSGGSTYLLVFLALPAAVVVLSPPVLNPLLDRALRLLRRPALEQRLTAATIVRVAALTGTSHVLLGVHAWLLARDLGAEGPSLLLLAVGAFALANVAGCWPCRCRPARECARRSSCSAWPRCCPSGSPSCSRCSRGPFSPSAISPSQQPQPEAARPERGQQHRSDDDHRRRQAS